jgi:hypothetical protein
MKSETSYNYIHPQGVSLCIYNAGGHYFHFNYPIMMHLLISALVLNVASLDLDMVEFAKPKIELDDTQAEQVYLINIVIQVPT